MRFKERANRRAFVGGSDARVIMGDDEAALLRLWKEKRGDVEPEDLSGDLLVQLGTVTEQLNRHWYEKNTGQVVTTCSGRCFTLCTAGWRPLWTGGSMRPERFSRPSSCCRGISPKKRPRKSTWLSCSTTCG